MLLRSIVAAGLVLAIAAPSSGQPAGRAIVSGSISLRFREAPVADVVSAVVGQALGRSYSIDPRVSGRMTLDIPDPVAPAAVLPLLDRSLRDRGARLIERGSKVEVVPLDAHASATTKTTPPPSRAAPVDRVVLQFVEPTALAAVVQSMLPTGVAVAAGPGDKSIVVRGPAAGRADAIELIRLFDVGWMAGRAFALAKLDNANPVAVARELELMFGTPGSDKARAMRFVPVERANAVLIVASNQAGVAQALRAVQTVLDTGSSLAGGRQLYIYPVANGRASDLARVLGGLFANDGDNELSAAEQRPGLTDPAIDRRVSAGDSANNEHVQPAFSADPRSGATLIDRPARQSANGQPLQFGTERLRIVADERNNAVAVLATAQDWRMIQDFLQRLDVRPLQIYIEATVAEVTLNDELRYGLQWFFSSGDFDFSLSDATDGAIRSRFPGFAGVFDNQSDARVVVDALDAITDVRVVSSPQVVVLNNRTATLQVGDDVPVAIRSAVSVEDPDAPLVNNIEFRPTGVILRVTPRANANGTVQLDVEQEVSDVVETQSSTIDSPTIQQRRIESTVSVRSGETIAMGGLIQDRGVRGRRGLPVLSALPVVGSLFGTTRNSADRTELLVLLTPRLLSSSADSRQLTEELRERMRAAAPLEAKIK